MSIKKQTAVGWVVEKLKAGIDPEDGSISMNWLHDGTIEQAKKLEKQQIIDSLHYFGIENAEEYYTETYGGQTYEQ
jgi:hypothetical protein